MNVSVGSYSTHQTQGIKQTRVTRSANAFANAFHTPSEYVSHAKRLCFTRTANAFTVSGTHASHVTQIRVSFLAHAFYSQSKHVYCFVHMRFTLEECVAPSSSHAFFQDECTFVLNFIVSMRDYIPLVSVECSWLTLLVARRDGTGARSPGASVAGPSRGGGKETRTRIYIYI